MKTSQSQPQQASQLYAIYQTAYEGFWELIEWVMKKRAQRVCEDERLDATAEAMTVRGRHGVFRVLEIGPGRAPCPYLTRLMTKFRPIQLTCVEQEKDAFQNVEWQDWIKSLEQQGITSSIRIGDCHPQEGDGQASRLLLSPGTDIFCHSPAVPYDLVLANAAIHEIHKGPEGREHWITEASLPAGYTPKTFFDWSTANRLLSDLDQNPLDKHQEDLFDRLHGDQQPGRIRFRGILFRRHLKALEGAVIDKGTTGAKVLSALRMNADQNRLMMIRDLFDYLHDLLDHEGDLLIGDHYFPSWMPMRNRVKNVKEAREKLHDVHRDDADFFLDPGLVLSCALTPPGRSYSRKKAWALYRDQEPATQHWMKGGFRELLEPEREGIGYRDGRRYYLCRLRPNGGRISEKNILEDCLSAGSTTEERFSALRESLNNRLVPAQDQLQIHLFDDARSEKDGKWIGKAIFRYMIDELSKRIAKWRHSQGWDPCEIIEYWFSYDSSLANVQRMSFLPRSEEVPGEGASKWKVQGGAGKRVIWDGAKYAEEEGVSWSTVCFNAWLASRKMADSPELLCTQSLHSWFVNESPQVSDAMTRLFQVSEKEGEALNEEQNCPIRSLTLYPPLEWIKEKHLNTPFETVLAEIAACKATGDPDHLFFELDGREDNAKPGWKSRIPNWSRRFGEILLDSHDDFVPKARVVNPPFEKDQPHFESLFSAFLASIFGIPPHEWLENCGKGWADKPLFADAFKSIPGWFGEWYAAFTTRHGPDRGSLLFPRFMTVLPLALPGANKNVASLILFTTRPLAGALLNMLALVSGRIVSQVRQIEQDVQMAEKAAAEERLKQQKRARVELEKTLEDLRVARNRAETAAAARDFFLAQVSHELRTPLNHVLGFCQLLEGTPLDEAQQRDLGKIHSGGIHLRSLIDDILDYQKIIMGQISLELEEFEAAPWVREVAEAMEPRIQDKGNRLEVHCAPDLGYIRCDRKRLRQVLTNLLSNAAKFTKQGVITVTARREGEPGADWVVVSVADSGVGISTEIQTKLFKPFPVADKRDNPEGTGLGLAICKTLCEKLGGDIVATSELGKGTTMTYRLPARGVTPDRVTTPTLSTPPPKWEPTVNLPAIVDRPCTILVIDDDPQVAELMKRFLESEGFDIHVASTGAAGLEMVRTLRPDVITLDLVMPGIDGWAVLAALKNDAEVHDIPVVIVSIQDDPSRGVVLGANEYVTKPVDWERLVGLLRKYRRAGNGGNILVVDDDRDWRDVCRRTLEQNGWTVSEAEDGQSALRRLIERRPSLVLLDLMLPVMDGFEFLEQVRRHPEWKDIPIVVMTAKELTDQERKRLNGAVHSIFAKGRRKLDDLKAEIVREVNRYRRRSHGAENKESSHARELADPS
jgi:signal transduction histidine kinase/CheY-like chemotaxis protein